MAQRSILAFFRRSAQKRTSTEAQRESGELEADYGQCSQAKTPRVATAVAESDSTVDGDSEEEHSHCRAFDSSQSQSSSITPDTSNVNHVCKLFMQKHPRRLEASSMLFENSPD